MNRHTKRMVTDFILRFIACGLGGYLGAKWRERRQSA